MAHEVKLSKNFRITIPKELRKYLDLKPGQTVFMFERDGSLRIACKRIEELRGMCPGMRWEEGDRDRNDRF